MPTYTCREAIVKEVTEFMAYTQLIVELWTDDATFLANVSVNIPKSSVHSGADWRGLWIAALYTVLDGYSVSHPDSSACWVAFDGEIVPTSRITGLATVATSGLYSDLSGVPVNATTSTAGLMSATDKTKLDGLTGIAYKSYQAMVSQTGTSAPTVTVLNNDLGATITWARSAQGVYTATAGSAVFTSATKVGFVITPSSSPLNNISSIRTSTTVVTLTTSQLNLLALGVANQDAILANTLVEIRVYP